jgi:hypothetical protein
MNCEGAFLRHEGALRQKKRLWKSQSAIRIPWSDDVADGDSLGRSAARPGTWSVSAVPSASLPRTERALGLRKAKLRAKPRSPVSRAAPGSKVARSPSSERGYVSQRRSGRRNASFVREVGSWAIQWGPQVSSAALWSPVCRCGRRSVAGESRAASFVRESLPVFRTALSHHLRTVGSFDRRRTSDPARCASLTSPAASPSPRCTSPCARGSLPP